MASTHLLLQEPEGSKYDAAIKWNIPVVSREWLFACAKSGKMENYKNYLVGCSRESKQPLDMVVNAPPQKPKEVVSVEKSRTEKELTTQCENTKDSTEAKFEANGYNKPHNLEEKNLAANITQMQKTTVASKPVIQKFFRPSFDLTDALQEVASPLVSGIRSRKSRGSRQSFPLDDLFAENVQQALKNVVKAGEEQHDKTDAPDTEKVCRCMYLFCVCVLKVINICNVLVILLKCSTCTTLVPPKCENLSLLLNRAFHVFILNL